MFLEAKDEFFEAVTVMRNLLVQKLSEQGKTYESVGIPVKQLVEPSIFDTEEIKTLKAILLEMNEKATEIDDV